MACLSRRGQFDRLAATVLWIELATILDGGEPCRRASWAKACYCERWLVAHMVVIFESRGIEWSYSKMPSTGVKTRNGILRSASSLVLAEYF